MYHSEAKFHSNFFLEITSGSMALFPLEPRQLWTWLAAWLASQLRGCSPSRGWRQLQLGSMRTLPPHPLPVLWHEADPRKVRAAFWTVSALWPWAPGSPWKREPAVWGPVYCTMLRFRKEANLLRQADPGGWRGWVSFHSQGRWKEKSFWRVGPFLSVKPEDKEWGKRKACKDT